MSGLWERWKDVEKGETLESFTIVTTDPNAVTEKVHSRMPVILKPGDYERWLDPGDPQQPPVDLLRAVRGRGDEIVESPRESRKHPKYRAFIYRRHAGKSGGIALKIGEIDIKFNEFAL